LPVIYECDKGQKTMQNPRPLIVLTIAGSDSSGGAGIQADLKTFAAHGCYGVSAITALTAQNTRGVTAIHVPPAAFLAAQLASVLTDFAPQAIKIGMLPDADCVHAVADALRGCAAPIVLDPVMVATSGAKLSESGAVQAMRRELFPLATLLTPNIPEAQALTGIAIGSEADMETAARAIAHSTHAVLLKGGHFAQDANDLLLAEDGTAFWLRAKRVESGGDTHGTGCTLSSAIACHLALGENLYDSCNRAKAWLHHLLEQKPDFGVPNAPVFVN
jgi:hydroxymethylpyrimidine/phosphomethylpyrimidine kinase